MYSPCDAGRNESYCLYYNILTAQGECLAMKFISIMYFYFRYAIALSLRNKQRVIYTTPIKVCKSYCTRYIAKKNTLFRVKLHSQRSTLNFEVALIGVQIFGTSALF